MLAEAPVVYRYGRKRGNGEKIFSKIADWSEINDTDDGYFEFSHTARLVDIQEIKK